jgi:hypothetical protein
VIKVLVHLVFLNLFLFALDSKFLIVSLLITLLAGYEHYLRYFHFKYRNEATVGKLRTRLPFLPYSELEFNRQFREIIPNQKSRAKRFHEKKNLSTPLINYVQGLRKTSFVLDSQLSGSKIYLFGGSTIDCQEVPDEYTVASSLQKAINNAPLNRFEVVNCGVAGATLKANYAHFKELPIKQGDICIFYFGVNELAGEDSKLYLTKFSTQLNSKLESCETLLRKFSIMSGIRLLGKLQKIDKNHYYFTEKSEKIKELLTQIYEQSKETKFEFVAILQPSLITRDPKNRFEKRFQKLFEKDYARQYINQSLIAKLQGESYFVDGRRIFNNSSLDVYLDWCHTNYLGNRIISDFIHSVLQQNFFRDDSSIFEPPKKVLYDSEKMFKSTPRAVSKPDEGDDDPYGLSPHNYPLF